MSTVDPFRARRLIVSAVVLIAVGLSAVAFRTTRDRTGHVTAAYRAEWEGWKSKRAKTLVTPGRPLSYTALAWLHPGRNTIGASARSDIHLAGSGVPATVGTLIRSGDEIRFEPAPGALVTIDSQPATATILRTDADSLPSQVRVGSAGFRIAKRVDSIGVRAWDADHPALRAFKGLTYFPLDPRWRIAGRFTPLPVPRKFAAATESGVAEEYEEVGSVDATIDGTPYRLTAYKGGKKQLFITFADASSGEETYGFRFLRATLDSATNDVALDFNFAYNPDCALSRFTTCPLPPPENRIRTKVLAGERPPQKGLRDGEPAGTVVGDAGVEIGRALSEYRATTLAGTSVQLGGRGGPLTLVNVWATWCTSCREEMQDLATIDREYGPRGLRVVAVSVDAGSETLVRRFVQRESLTFPVVHDQAGTIQKQYHIVGVPTSYLVAADGRLLWQQVGGIHGNLPKVRIEVEKALQDFGPNVTIFDPATPAATIQSRLDTIFASQESSEFGERRFAVLFKPGAYNVDARIGFYTQVSGLGISPDDVVINGGMRADARWRKGNATLNFWRAVENMAVVPAGGFDRWAVSQAAPMRRMHIRGDLVLDDGGWSSGGFLADSKVDGQVRSGSQQQWLTRNSTLGSWKGSNWNMVFVGTRHAPANSFPDPPYTTIDVAPAIREKPFLIVDRRGEWNVFVPALRSNADGTTWSSGKPRGVARPLSEFVIVKPGTSAATMNGALARNKSLIITPGVYHLDAPLHITRANTIVLGLGLATLVPDNGVSAITVDDVDGVTLAGLLVDAGPISSPVLVQIGPSRSSVRHSSNPTVLSDLFVRVGGAGVGKATRSLEINSNDVIGDHLWLWRADHGNGVGWTSNTAANGLVVNGNGVTMYGLFVEHYQQHQVQWNGNGGRTYMFQNEMPYDVPDQAEWMSGATRGFAAYRVDAAVTSHEAWGLGSYCFFNRNPAVVAEHAFEVPVTPGVRLRNMIIVSLGGGRGTISHVVNETGNAARAGAAVQKLVSGP